MYAVPTCNTCGLDPPKTATCRKISFYMEKMYRDMSMKGLQYSPNEDFQPWLKYPGQHLGERNIIVATGKQDERIAGEGPYL
ncbi:MAG: hypothetical protein R6U78_15105 [Bacteroidales bacterium]